MNLSIEKCVIENINKEFVSQFSKNRQEPGWVLELRLRALKMFEELNWPTNKDEKWKRVPWDKINLEKMNFFSQSNGNATSVSDLTPEFRSYGKNESNMTSQASCYLDASQGFVFDIPEIVTQREIHWISLSEAFIKKETLVKDAWEKAIASATSNKLLLLNLCLADAGTCLIIPKGQALKTPFYTYIATGAQPGAHFILNFLFVEEAGEAHVWEEQIGNNDVTNEQFISSYTFIHLKENAKASCYFLEHWNSSTSHFQFHEVIQGAFSRYNEIAVSVGGKAFRNETNLQLGEKGAENKILGVLFGDKDQYFENWITQNHTAPKTTSDIQYRGALKGHSRSFFSGMVYINKDGQQSDAFQSSKALLLSKDAKADAIPNLEILADDVKCSHGAAVGPVDDDMKFYLQTRGMSINAAEDLIVEGFFEPVIAEVPSLIVQERLRSFIEEKLKKS
ncbi:MAG: Fe-S cluster assembly protein SufD [Elusimicrobiota bacterium]